MARGEKPQGDVKSLPQEATDGPPPNGEKKAKKSPRKASDDLRAMNQIDGILEKFEPEDADRIMRYCSEKLKLRLHKKNHAEVMGLLATRPMPMTSNAVDPRRLPGGDLYTPPLPGMEITNSKVGNAQV